MKTLNLNNNVLYNESDIVQLIKKNNPFASDQRIKWILYDMEKAQEITRVDKKTYCKNGNLYTYAFYSKPAKDINTFLSHQYPNIIYDIWESRQLNEWLNLLIGKNTIYIEIETGYEELLFDTIYQKFGKSYMILYNPKNEDITRYAQDNLVIIKTLFSRAPILKASHKISSEKLIVDIFADKYLNYLDTRSKQDIIQGITQNYNYNKSTLFAYAKRRRCEKKIQEALDIAND